MRDISWNVAPAHPDRFTYPSPEELTQILKQQIEVWGATARDVGIKPE